MITLFARRGAFLAALILASWSFAAVGASATPALDPAFAGGLITPKVFPNGKWPQVARGAVLQADGKVVVPMSLSTKYGQRAHRPVLRYGLDGKLDKTYGTKGVAWLRMRGIKFFGLSGINLDSDGRTLLLGSSQRSAKGRPSPFIARLTTTGRLDRSFGNHGATRLASFNSYPHDFKSATQLPDGKILIVAGGAPYDAATMLLIRLTRNGRIDSGYADHGIKTVKLAQHAFFVTLLDAQIHGDTIDVLASFENNGPVSTCKVLRTEIASRGGRVHSFGADGWVKIPVPENDDNFCGSLALTSGGGVAVAGQYMDSAQDDPYLGFVAKFRADGSRDPAFGAAGIALTGPAMGAFGIAALADGSYLLAGTQLSEKDSTPKLGTMSQLDAAGKTLPAFGTGGVLTLTPRASAGPINHTAVGNVVVFTTYAKHDFGRSQIAKLTN